MVCASLGLAGCGSSSAADRTPAPAQVGRADLEEDGLPAQVAPPASVRQQAADPFEPYSPRYGSLPPYRAETAYRLSSAEEDAIIAQAITAHEMRKP